MTKVLLIFPPGWSTNGPYLSLPQLSAYLNANNIETRSIDLNIEIYDSIVSDASIKESLNKIELILYDNSISEDKRNELLLCKNLYDKVYGKVDDFKNKLRSGIINPEEYLKITKTIEISYRIYSAPYFPGRIFNGQVVKLKKFVPKSYLKPFDYELNNTVTRIIDFFNDRVNNPIWEIIEKYFRYFNFNEFDLIGISVSGFAQLMPSLCISQIIKRNHDIPIILGGAIMPYIIDGVKNNSTFFNYIDAIVNGEGELPLLNLCKSNTNFKDACKKVDGIVYYDDIKKTVIENINIDAIDINEIPTPDFRDFDLKKYFIPNDLLMLPILGSTGCYWNKCAFCGINCNYNERYRKRKTSLIIEDMQYLSSNFGINSFRFIDNCISPDTMSKISRMILDLKEEFNWTCMCRFEKAFTKETWDIAYSAGLKVVSFGLESNNQDVLDNMQKGIQANDIPRILKQCRNSGIFTHCFYIVGFPGENDNQWEKTVEFIKENKESFSSVTFSKFRLECKSPIFNDLAKFHLKIKDSYPDDYINPNYEYEDFCNADLQLDLIRSEVMELNCSEINMSGLDDFYVIGLVLNGKLPKISEWQSSKTEISAAVKLKPLDQSFFKFNRHLSLINIKNKTLLFQNKTNNYWIISNEIPEMSHLEYFIEEELTSYYQEKSVNENIEIILDMIFDTTITIN